MGRLWAPIIVGLIICFLGAPAAGLLWMLIFTPLVFLNEMFEDWRLRRRFGYIPDKEPNPATGELDFKPANDNNDWWL